MPDYSFEPVRTFNFEITPANNPEVDEIFRLSVVRAEIDLVKKEGWIILREFDSTPIRLAETYMDNKIEGFDIALLASDGTPVRTYHLENVILTGANLDVSKGDVQAFTQLSFTYEVCKVSNGTHAKKLSLNYTADEGNAEL